MTTYQLESLYRVNRFTPGRRAYVARQMKPELEALGLVILVALCDAIIEAEQGLITLMREFRNAQAGPSQATWTPDIIAQDQLLDRLLGELRDLLFTLGKRTGTPRGDAAAAVHAVAFKGGLTWYTQAPIDEENERVAELLTRLATEGERLAQATADDLVADVRAAHTRYNDLITQFRKGSRLDYDAIKAADLDNQRRLLALISRVIAWSLDQADPLAAREQLLKVVAQKDQEITDLIRERRRIRDIDPETGVPEADA